MSNFVFDTQGPDGKTSLYSTNGTASGTVNLDMSRFGAFMLGNNPDFTAMNGKLYFIGDGTTGPEPVPEIFSTDGTMAGTTAMPVTGSGGYVAPRGLWVLNNRLLTSGTGKNGSSGLYANGIAIETGYYVASPDALVVSHGLGIFAATSSKDGSTSIWRTDGTAAGTYSITPKGAALDPVGFTSVGNGKTVFANQAADGASTLWTTDGTTAGTHMVSDKALGTNVTLPGATTNGKAVFTAIDAANNISVWASDGTTSGTVELAISGQNGNMIRTPYGFQIFGKDVVYSTGYGLVVTDGTPKGTIGLPDSDGVQSYVVLGSRIIFNAYDIGATLPGEGVTTLFVSDGTVSGTHQIKLPYGLNVDSSSFVVSGSQVVFNAVNAAGQEALYATDGTVAGTKALSLPAGVVTSSSEPLAALPAAVTVPTPLTGLLPNPLHVGVQTVTGTGGTAGLQLERITQGTYDAPGSIGWVKATVASDGNWSAVLTFTKPGMLAHVYAATGGSQKVVDLVDGTPTMAAAVKAVSGAVVGDMSATAASKAGSIVMTSPAAHLGAGTMLDMLGMHPAASILVNHAISDLHAI